MKAGLYNNYLNHVQVLQAKLTNKEQYKDKTKGYLDCLINNQTKTPKGLLYIDMWVTLRHAANAAWIMLQVNTHSYRQYSWKWSPTYGVTQENGLNYVHHKHGGPGRKTQDE